MSNNIWIQHVTFCIARKLTGQNYESSFMYTSFIYYSNFWETIVFLISHPCETETNHKVQSWKLYFLRRPDCKEALRFTCCWNSHSMFQAFRFIPANPGNLNIHLKIRSLGFWSHHKLRSFTDSLNVNENTTLWSKAKIWNASTKISTNKISQYIFG